MLLHELLLHSADRTPDAIAVITPREATTYAAVAARATAVARELSKAGLQHGDRVVVALENSTEFIAAYFGIIMAGGVAVPLAPGARNDRLPKVIVDAQPHACIVDDQTWPALAPTAETTLDYATYVVPRQPSTSVPAGTKPLPAIDGSGVNTEPRGTMSVRLRPDDLAAIVYTSGSTGAPRGVMLTHRNIVSNTSSIVEYLGLSSADRVMVVLPFYYVYGLSLLHTHVMVGGGLVLDNRFAFPNVVLRGMQTHAVTGFAGVPSTFASLLHRSNLATTPLPSLRYVTQAGGPMPPARVQEWRRAMPEVPFYVMYGATEASARLAYLHPTELERRVGSIGRAIPNVELRVLKDNGEVAAPGEIGEIVARGDNISPGYWNCPSETHERFGSNGYRTGDLAYADADGFLYLVGRRHDMIKVGAHRVSAKEIEDALNEHPAVHEAAVVAAPDDFLGEVPIAHVALRHAAAVDSMALTAFCRTRLADHKVPARICFLQELPKTGAGKIDKSALIADAQSAAVSPAS